MDMAEQTIGRTDIVNPPCQSLTAIVINLASLTGLIKHSERRLVRNKHVHTGRDGLHEVILKSLDKKRQTMKMHSVKHYAVARQEITILVQPVNTAVVKAHVVIAGYACPTGTE